MSKIALPMAELKPALIGLGKIVSKRCTLPVVNHLKIERTADGWTALTGTDLDHFVTVRLEQPSEGSPLSLLVPYDELLKITKSCQKNDTVLIGTGENPSDSSVVLQYAIGNQIAEAKVASLPVEEFPEIPRIKGDPIPLNDALRASIHEALDCDSTDETRFILNGAFIDTSKPNAHYVVGTDGRHLYSSNSFSLPMKDSLIIPTHKFIGWKEFNNDGEWQLKVMPPAKKDEPGHLQISTRRWRFITRQIEGNFPNWRQVVPDGVSKKTTVEFDPSSVDAVIQIIERMPCGDAINFAIGLEWKGKRLSLLGRTPNAEKWTAVNIDSVKCIGAEVTIFLNRHLLIKALQFGLTTVEIIDSMSPLKCCHGGRQMIIMPTRPQAAVSKAPAPQEEEKPADPSPAAQPTPAMPNEPEAPTIEDQIESVIIEVESMKDSFQQQLTGLKTLTTKLKTIQREHKSSTKELHTVRQTLKGLQGLKL